MILLIGACYNYISIYPTVLFTCELDGGDWCGIHPVEGTDKSRFVLSSWPICKNEIRFSGGVFIVNHSREVWVMMKVETNNEL